MEGLSLPEIPSGADAACTSLEDRLDLGGREGSAEKTDFIEVPVDITLPNRWSLGGETTNVCDAT